LFQGFLDAEAHAEFVVHDQRFQHFHFTGPSTGG
jgi:hypothetical protein